MKVQNDKIKVESNEVKSSKAMASGKASATINGEQLLGIASDVFRSEANGGMTDSYTSVADYKARIMNDYLFGVSEKPSNGFQQLMPLPSWSSQRGLSISADAYESRVNNLQKSVYEMKANLVRELDFKGGQYTVGEKASMLDRIKELDDMLRNCEVQLQQVRADKETARILQDLEDRDII